MDASKQDAEAVLSAARTAAADGQHNAASAAVTATPVPHDTSSTTTSSSAFISTSRIPARPSRDLRGKVAVVTGAGSADPEGLGNGRAIAIMLAEDGCNVLCVDRELALAQRTVELITSPASPYYCGSSATTHPPPAAAAATASATTASAPGPRALAVEADVTSAAACAHLVATALATWSRLDILVNNVGVGGARGTAVDVDMDQFLRGLEINVSSMVLMSKYAIPAMVRNRSGSKSRSDGGGGGGESEGDDDDDDDGYTGAIVNLGSVAGIRGGTPHILYPTSKGAVVNMTRAMAAHHAAQGIRVNCVCPGMVYTPMMYYSPAAAAGAGAGAGAGLSSGSVTMPESARASRRDRSLLKTEGTAWDTAAAVRFLASPLARWITGTIMVVDAGATAAVGADLPGEASVSSRGDQR